MGKEEIALHKQFLLFPQCFQKTCTADMYKPGQMFGKGLNMELFGKGLTLHLVILTFNDPGD